MEIKSPEDLLWALSQFREPPSQPPSQAPTDARDYKHPLGYILFLGAGASVEAGIPTAYQLIMHALRRRRAQNSGLAESTAEMTDEEILRWAVEARYVNESDTERSKYAQVMDKLFDTPALREEFVRRELRAARMSEGYRILGELIAQGIFDTILTTNFDHLVRQGAEAVRPWPIDEVNSNEQYKNLSPFTQEPRVIRLHGDFWHGNLRNTPDELRRTPKIIFDAVKPLFRSYGLIVIGYGGEDASLMHGLFPNELWQDESVLRSGLYWCDIKEPDRLAPKVKSFLTEGHRAGRAFYVKVEGFNSLMRLIGNSYGISLSLEREMEADIKVYWEWLALLTDLASAVSSAGGARKLRQEFLERLVLLLRAERAICASRDDGSAGWNVSTMPDEPLMELDAAAVAQSVAELHDHQTLDYKQVSARDLSVENVFYPFFKGCNQIETFTVWREGNLTGLISFVSSESSMINNQRTRLIRAAVKLLLML